jgi:Carboxypeptidase regulatory-like domain
MREGAARRAVGVSVLAIAFLLVPCLQAQETGATLSGKVTDPSGAAVANAKISIKNLATGESAEMQTDATGQYTLSKLTADRQRC